MRYRPGAAGPIRDLRPAIPIGGRAQVAERQSRDHTAEERLAAIQRDLPDVAGAIRDVHEAGPAIRIPRNWSGSSDWRSWTRFRRLKSEMSTLKERIGQLKDVEGAVCPVCGHR
jgi:hypothetical protein